MLVTHSKLIVLASVLAVLARLAAMPTRNREAPLNYLDQDVRDALWQTPGGLEQKALGISVMLHSEYSAFLWYVFVFPDSRNDPSDTLTIPGDNFGVAKARALRMCGIVARHVERADPRDGPSVIATVMYQHRDLAWRITDVMTLVSYMRQYNIIFDDCILASRAPSAPLDLTQIAVCMIQRGRNTVMRLAMHGLRTVVVLRCSPYAMLNDEGLLRPGYKAKLRGPDSEPEDSIEAFVLPPIPLQ